MMGTLTVLHTCNGIDHEAPIEVTKVVPLHCGCHRHEGYRCDGTAIHVIVGAHCEAQEASAR